MLAHHIMTKKRINSDGQGVRKHRAAVICHGERMELR